MPIRRHAGRHAGHASRREAENEPGVITPGSRPGNETRPGRGGGGWAAKGRDTPDSCKDYSDQICLAETGEMIQQVTKL